MKTARLYVLAAALAGLGILLGLSYRMGVQHQKAQQAEVRIQHIHDTLRILDTVYRRDTLRLTKYVNQWDTAVVTMDRWIHDTVIVKEYIALADTTIKLCRFTLSTCEEQKRLLREEVRQLRIQVDNGKRIPLKDKVLWSSLGAIAGIAFTQAAVSK